MKKTTIITPLAALEAWEAYEEIRDTGNLSDEYHKLIAPWKEAIEAEVGDEFPVIERFAGWHRHGLRVLCNRRRVAALAVVRGQDI